MTDSTWNRGDGQPDRRHLAQALDPVLEPLRSRSSCSHPRLGASYTTVVTSTYLVVLADGNGRPQRIDGLTSDSSTISSGTHPGVQA